MPSAELQDWYTAVEELMPSAELQDWYTAVEDLMPSAELQDWYTAVEDLMPSAELQDWYTAVEDLMPSAELQDWYTAVEDLMPSAELQDLILNSELQNWYTAVEDLILNTDKFDTKHWIILWQIWYSILNYKITTLWYKIWYSVHNYKTNMWWPMKDQKPAQIQNNPILYLNILLLLLNISSVSTSIACVRMIWSTKNMMTQEFIMHLFVQFFNFKTWVWTFPTQRKLIHSLPAHIGQCHMI